MARTLHKSLAARWGARSSPRTRLLLGLLAPTVVTGMAHHMFGVALPAIRDAFGIDADTAAWVVMAYSLPFMALMPLYGRLGDGVGKRRLLLLGTAIFGLGTLLVLAAPNLPLLLLGRVLQGVGTAGFVPLCIAIISQRFAAEEQGRVMGSWNAIIPLTGLLVPYLAGLLVDRWGWWAIFPPLLLAAVVAFRLIRTNIPARSGGFQVTFVRAFDWTGVGLLSGGLITLLLYTASRPITGVPALQDLRLLAVSLALFGALIYWERRRAQPYIELRLFTNRTFTLASVVAGLRMFLMSGISFALPLYLTDIHAASASVIGTVLALQAGMLFLVSRAGGQIADRWGSRLPIVGSMLGLVAVMGLLAALPASAPLWILFAAAAGHGLIIGLSLAPLHRAAMRPIDAAEVGMAAGLYSMLRFAGQILGTALAGVLLQQGIDRLSAPVDAYQTVFWFQTWVALAAVLLAWGVRET